MKNHKSGYLENWCFFWKNVKLVIFGKVENQKIVKVEKWKSGKL